MSRGGGAGGLVNLEFDTEGLERIASSFRATPAQLDKALDAALRKMANWLRAQSIKGLSKELRVQQKILRGRLKTFRLARRGAEQGMKVWYGLDPISYARLGTPRQTGAGVRVAGHFVEGAFVARQKNGALAVFKRKGRGRMPLVKQYLEIVAPAEAYIEDRVLGTAAFEAQFFKLFEHELQWRTKTQL
jgi:hypothetical protein